MFGRLSKFLKISKLFSSIWIDFFQDEPAVSVKIAEQYFRDNFSGQENDFTLENGFYQTTYQQNVLTMVHDDSANGESK